MNEIKPYETVPSFEFVAGPARIYHSPDGLHQVVIADSQAAQWDQLKHFHELDKKRFAPDAVPPRADNIWPEDVFAAIKNLPNPELVTQVVLQNYWLADPGSAGVAPASFDLPKAAAQAFSTGRIVFSFGLSRNLLENTLLLAWTRLLWFKYEVLTHFFRYAAFLERHGYFIDQTAGKTDVENWAVHLVGGLLLADEDKFASFIAQAPLRAVILASALQRTLDESSKDEASDEASSKKHTNLEKRLQVVTEQTLLQAQEKLLCMVKQTFPASDSDDDHAFRLLLLLGTEPQLASLPIKVANLANEPHTNAVLAKLGAIKTLMELNLSQTLISREGTGFLADLTNLQKLDLSDTKVMSSSLTPLRALSSLEELNLSGTQINESALPSLRHLNGLKKLNIEDTALVASKDALQELLPNCQLIAGG